MAAERFVCALSDWTVEKHAGGWYFARSANRHSRNDWRGPYRSEASVAIALNDCFRTTMTGSRVPMTASVNALPSDVEAMVIRHVATFSDFNKENDPHQEHDFGNFSLAGCKFFWKIDCYDAKMESGSEDPADLTKTMRVLTIMLAEEY